MYNKSAYVDYTHYNNYYYYRFLFDSATQNCQTQKNIHIGITADINKKYVHN